MRTFAIAKHRKIWYTVSLIITVINIASIAVFGFRYGLDFTGGSLLELEYKATRPSNEVVIESLATVDLGGSKVQPSGDRGVLIRMPEIDENKHQAVLVRLREEAVRENSENTIQEHRFESFGPSLGSELKRQSIYAILLVLAAIISYLAYAFRKVSHPVASWKFGTVAIIALAHDTLMLAGAFALLGYFFGTEIDGLFVTALLTLLGFSVHDTIVTLDRIRENLFKHQDQTFESLVENSINETITRSINTSFTTLLAVTAIFFFGGASIRDFSLALIIGLIVGTYSSIFIAAPLLITWYEFSRKRAK